MPAIDGSEVANSQPKSLPLFRRYYGENGKRLANKLIAISLNDKYVYFKIHKVASTSLNVSLGRMEVRNLPQAEVRPHPDISAAVHIRPFQLPKPLLNSVLKDPKYRRIVFVRHPFSRVLSCYRHRIATEKRNSTRQNVLNQMSKLGKDVSGVISFDDFLAILPDMTPKEMDSHYRPQFTLCGAGYINYDFVGKLETMDEDVQRLQNYTGLPILDFYRVKQRHQTGSLNDWKDELTPTRKRIIEQVYKDDFEAFDYDI